MAERERWIEHDAAVVWHGFTQMSAYTQNTPIVVERGDGRELIDTDGTRYLDAISSVWMITLGHNHPELNAAAHAQLDRIAHSTMLGNGNTATIEFAEALASVVPVDEPRFLFASDGASAVEQALKIAFQYQVNRGDSDRIRYLAFDGAYHGDTIGAISVGAGGFGTDLFDPLRFRALRSANGEDSDWAAGAEAIIAQHGSGLAAMIIEPLVQGAGGVQLLAPSDLPRVVRAARAAGMLVIFDEVATGFGRTGTLFATEQVGERPDIMCLGKGITGGYIPMSATAVSSRVAKAFLGPDLSEKTLYHGHSYGGNALAAAVGMRHLELILDPLILENVSAHAHQLAELLEAQVAPLTAVQEVRQHGLMVGVELNPGSIGSDELFPRRVCVEAVRRGVLLRSIGNTVPIVPILTSTPEEITRIVDTLATAIQACK